MRWQLGGNLEPVRIICETDWTQCPRAILKYIWTEVVTDVVDYLITEGIIVRVFAILISCMALRHILYIKRKCANKPTPSEDTLNRVGCKVEDLELKINILTYKLQYGTWPLPHQIRNSGLRKQLRNLRLTLSTSSDRNAWIKRLLLSSTTDTCHLSQPQPDSTSVQRMTDTFDTKTGYVSSEIHRDITPTDYSDIKSSKTTSAESLQKNNLESSNQRGLSKSENLGKLHRTDTQLSLLLQKDSLECFEWKKVQKQKRSKFSTSRSRIAPCERYTESLRECKKFLRELKESNKGLELERGSSSVLSNNDSFMKEICPDEKSSLHAQTTDARNASRRFEYVGDVETMPAKMKREEKNVKTIMNKEMIHDEPNYVPPNLVPLLNSNGHNNLTTNFPIESSMSIVIPPGDNVIQMSRKTLHQIKQQLESLDNTLRAYGMLNSRIRNIKEGNGNDIRTIYRNVIDTLDDIKLEIETRKNEASFNPKQYSDKVVQTTSSDYELSKSSDEGSSIPMKTDSLAKKNHEKSTKLDATFTQPRYDLDLILDHEPVEIILTNRDVEKLSQLPIPMETDEDPSIASTTSSQLEISKASDFESDSTALLLREALECKKELLSRVNLQKFYSNIEFGQNNENYKDNFKNDNNTHSDTDRTFPSKLLDIIAEERSISSCTDKSSKTYIFLRMKQQGELSDHSLSSLLNQESPIEKLSKEVIPIVSSRYFSINDFTTDRSDGLHDFRELRNIIVEEVPTDKDTNSLRGKKRHKEIATCDDNDMDVNRKRLCHRVENCSTSYVKLHRARSVQESCSTKRSNVERYSGSLSKMSNIDELLQENITYSHVKNNTIIKDEQIFVETNDLSWNPMLESSSSGSVKYRFTIDNGSMTNFLSSTDSNIETIKYPVIAKNDNDEILCSNDLALKRRPGTFSFAHLKMNTVIPKDGELLIRNPYFLAETMLSEATCGETIEVNLIPLSVSTAIIDSQESNVFAVARNKVFRDITDVSSTLRICYNDDLENGNITEIIEHEIGRNEIQAMQSVKSTTNVQDHENYDKDNVCVGEVTGNQIEKSEYVEIQHANPKFPNNDIDVNNVSSIDNEDSTKSRFNMISQQSSSYFTGDTSSSTNGLDMGSFNILNSNIEENPDVREIDIRTEILESCIDSCLSLLNDKKEGNTNDTPFQQENKSPIECVDNDNDASNKSSALYVDANTISQTFDNDMKRDDTYIVKESQERRRELIFDGSIRYKKPSASKSTLQNQKRNPQSIKPKPTKVDIKSKSTISMDRSTYSKKSTASDSHLKAKSNFSIIGNNSKDLATDSTRSCTRPSSCNLSRERSRSYIISRRSESSSRSATISQSEDQLKEEETFKEKPKLGKHSKQSLSSPKSFSKSCIPILKSRLDARRGEQTSRPKSPMRGPLTMTGLCRNKIDNNVQDITEVVMPTEGSTVRKEESQQHPQNNETMQDSESSKENTNVIGKNCASVVPREQTVIYVNIVQQHDRNVTRILDPEKFLEYAKSESIAQNETVTKLQPSMLPKIVTIVSSVSNEPSMNTNDDNSLSNLHISTGTLKSLWSVTIQQKEMEVTAKPSVTDTSTSISDLQQATESLHEHQIFGTPKELTNEEYSYMLQILTQKTNLTHLKEIQNLCNRLRPKNDNSG